MIMARSLQYLSLLSRLGALSVIPSVSANSCRCSSKGASKAWMGQSHVHKDRASTRPRYSEDRPEEDGELEDVEDKLQALVDESRKKQRTVKYHILRRKMTPPGAPQRKLTWDAIEQIRFLKQEQPEEWTVERLAEGFSVTSDVILRVLRSKFVPPPEIKAKQDTKVMARLGQQVLPLGAGTRQDRLPGNRTPATLPSGSTEGALIPVADQVMRGKDSRSLAERPVPVSALPTQFIAGISKDATKSTEEDDDAPDTIPLEDTEDEDSWDGFVFTEEDLEEFMMKEKPSPALQVGNDFFDAEGNFLYRI